LEDERKLIEEVLAEAQRKLEKTLAEARRRRGRGVVV